MSEEEIFTRWVDPTIEKLQQEKQDLLNWLESKNKIIIQQHNIVEPVIKVQEVIDKIKEVM